MMRAQLRYLDSPDVPCGDLASYSPPSPDDFLILVGAAIGPSAESGEEIFYFIVCTPTFLERKLLKEKYLFPRNYLLLDLYDYAVLRGAINDLCERSEGPDWETIAKRLARYAQWEFEEDEKESLART
ncbi:MAG: Imm8 family immunity protein [Dehalococcoidia bacterium]